MAINKSKVLAGGVAAGVVMAVGEIALNKLVFGARMTAQLNAFKAGMGDQMNQGMNWLIMPLINDIIAGILLVWLYAAIRSRFSPGQRTSVYAAIYFWIVASFFTMSFAGMGMMSWKLWCAYAVAWLVITIVGANVGARIYTENGATT